MSSRRKQILMPKLPSDVTVSQFEAPKQIKLKRKVKPSKVKQPAKSLKSDVKLPQKKINKNIREKKQAACIIELDEQKDFYPNRLKRKLNDKKIVLKPKHNMKVVFSINKRKSAIPRKGKSSYDLSDESDIPDMEMSMYEAVRVSEETRSLSDEDLLEILTCPSPVWWEDPPDAGFVESAVYRLTTDEVKNGRIKVGNTSIESSNKAFESKTIDQLSRNKNEIPPNNAVDFKHLNKFKIASNNFKQKKKKLEDILCNLQQKTKHVSRLSENTEGEDLSDISMNEEEILKNLENISIPIEGSVDNNTSVNTLLIKMDMKDSKNNEVISDNNDEICKSVQCSNNTHNMESMKLLSNECTPKEICRPSNKIDTVVVTAPKQENFSNDKYTNGKSKSYKSKLGVCLSKGRNLRSVIKRPERLIEFSTTDKNTKIPNNDSVSISRRKNESNLDINLNKTNLIKVRSSLVKKEFKMQIPDKLPPLKRKPFIQLKDECKSSDSSEMTDIDSISDTNIEFISDDDDGSKNDNFSTDTNNLDNNSNIDQNYVKRNTDDELPKKLNNDITEYITVYKIVTNNEAETDEALNKLDKKQRDVRKLNSFFKKCKNNKRLKKDNATIGECEMRHNKRFVIDFKNNSDATDEQNRLKGCDYCIVQLNNGQTNFSCETCNMAVYTCGQCNYRTSNKDSISKHMSRCEQVREVPWSRPYVLNQT